MKKVLICVAVCLAMSTIALPCYGWCRWCYGPRGWYHPNGIWLADGITGIVANGLGIINSLYRPYPIYPGGSIIVQRPLYRYPVYERQWYAPPPPPPPLY